MPIRFEYTGQEFDNSGLPLAGGKLYFYTTGTTTPKNTYSDVALTTPNANPVILDSAGRIPDVFMTTGNYKVIIKDSNDVTLDTMDPISGKDVSTVPTPSGGDANKIIRVDAAGASYELSNEIREQKTFASQSGGSIVRIRDDGAVSGTDANPYHEYGWSSTIGGSYTRLGFVGFQSSVNQDLYVSSDSGNVRINPSSTAYIILSRPTSGISGSSSVVAYNFDGDIDTGFYGSAGTVSVSTNGARKAYFDSTGARIQMATGTGYAFTTGLANSNVGNAVGNIGSGTDDLLSYTLPANSTTGNVSNENGRSVRITAWGRTANNANAKTLTLLFGGSTVVTRSMTANAANTWAVQAIVTTIASGAQGFVVTYFTDGTTVVGASRGTLTVTDTAAIIIKCTAAATSDNDIIQDGMVVELV